jgi:hypothetical protein
VIADTRRRWQGIANETDGAVARRENDPAGAPNGGMGRKGVNDG